MLQVENIVKRFGDHVALNGVSMEVPAGKVFGLLGPNGAGKTTLIRIITRITGPDEGTVRLNGQPMTDDSVGQLGYLPEERGLYKKMKVGEQSLYLAQLKGLSKKEATKRLKEWFERWEMSGWWNKKVEELSKGMAQKVQFITTVLHEPKLLILDEPFSGFDPINAELIRTEILRLRDEGATVMLSTHNMGSVEQLCDHIALIDKSRKVLDGEVRAIRRQYATNTYRIEYEGTRVAFANALAFVGTLVDTVENGNLPAGQAGMSVSRVQLGKGDTLNDVLRQVLPSVKIHGVQEEVPSMNEVFIRAVGGDEAKPVTKEMTE